VDVVTETVGVAAPDGAADALLSRPASGGPYPGVVLFTDAYGIRPAVESHVARLAGAGYCVLAPNVFYRSGPPPVVEHLAERLQDEDRSALFAELRPKIQLVTAEAARADAGAWLEFLRRRPEAADGPVGTVGYCMGGRLSTRMAGEFPVDVAGAASFHGGRMATDEDDSPHLVAVHASAELYFGHADNDASMPPDQMARLTEALAAAHVRHTAELYTGARHGWTQTDTPVYDEASSERHLMRLLELFGRVLRPG
jgi:carboxymethylenebutenolidase